jgi:hypothetical protein
MPFFCGVGWIYLYLNKKKLKSQIPEAEVKTRGPLQLLLHRGSFRERVALRNWDEVIIARPGLSGVCEEGISRV